MRARTLISDVDRTLLTHRHVLPPAVAQAAAEARRRGLTLFLASARSPVGVAPVARALGAAMPHICFNGALVSDPEGGAPWLSRTLPRAAALEAFALARRLGGRPVWHGADGALALHADAGAAREQTAITGDPLDLVAEETALAGEPYKILVAQDPARSGATAEALRAHLGEGAAVTRSAAHLVEVVAPDVSKAEAAAAVCARLGIAAEACAAAGDGENDIALLAWAGTAVTVENAIAPLRERAHFIAPHCDEGGMATAFEWLTAP